MAPRPFLSLCMVVKNEELLMEQCLETAKAYVDEIIVVDTGSTDRTLEIAQKFGARVILHPWDGSLGRARNVYVRNARGAWILVLDGDERIAPKDFRKIKNLIQEGKCLGYYVEWRDYQKNFNLLSDWHPNDGAYPKEEKFSQCPGWSRNRVLRLFQRKEGVQYEEGYSVHTNPLKSLSFYDGEIKDSPIVVHHFQYLKGGETFIFQKQKDRLSNEIRHTHLYPRDPLAYRNIAKTLFSMKKDGEALRFLKKARRLDPRHPEVYFLLGMVYQEKGDYGKAARNLRKALRLKPRFADAWTVLGMVYDLEGRHPEAEEALKKATRFHPTHLLARNALGVVYQNQGRFSQAEREFKKALEIHPEFFDARINLARLRESSGR